jgi:signal transduction histidine kinase
MAWGLESLGELYMHLGDMPTAKKYLDQAEKLAVKLRARQILLPLYLAKIKWLELNGNPHQALAYFKKYEQVKDSVYNAALSNRVSSLQNEYTILQKNQQIEILNRDKEISEREVVIQQDKVRQQRLIIFFGTSFFLMLLGGAYVMYRNYKKVRALNFKIQESSEEVQAQSEELQLSNQTIVQINERLEAMVDTRTKELKQAYKELDTFFYRSSHDFRRPLTTFMGLAEVAKITVKDQAALELFGKVNETARNLDKMLVKLQSVSEMGSHQLAFKEIFIREIFESELDQHRDLIRDYMIKVTNVIEPGLTFYSYPALIKIICENLIENAIFFRKDYEDGIKLSAFSVDGGITITIEDQGQGIDPEYIDRVFDMYFRANERSKGNGLGLYIVKKVTEKLNGTISLTSTKGVGTLVTIFIPNQVNG